MTVWIEITTRRRADGETETLELVTGGTMEPAEEGWTLVYNESESMGLVGVTTVMTATDSCVTMERRGTLNTLMVMQKGKRTHCEYDTGYGHLMLGIYTGGIDVDLAEDGGTIRFDYTLDINAGLTSAHDIFVRVRPARDGDAENEGG